MVRAAAIVVTLIVGLLAAGLVLEDPEILGAAWAKLTEGGLWTGLVAFILAAAFLGIRRRGTTPRRR